MRFSIEGPAPMGRVIQRHCLYPVAKCAISERILAMGVRRDTSTNGDRRIPRKNGHRQVALGSPQRDRPDRRTRLDMKHQTKGIKAQQSIEGRHLLHNAYPPQAGSRIGQAGAARDPFCSPEVGLEMTMAVGPLQHVERLEATIERDESRLPQRELFFVIPGHAPAAALVSETRARTESRQSWWRCRRENHTGASSLRRRRRSRGSDDRIRICAAPSTIALTNWSWLSFCCCFECPGSTTTPCQPPPQFATAS